ncbi:hypothetical protein, partial [Streptomyces huiliensis]|uniref:hypothetical protein n=1 Tax=Streptomyces huiliensis TaxID=2876027 RepID=UPI001CC0F9B9
LAALLRVAALAAVPFGAAAAVAGAGVRLAGGFWGTAVLVLVAVSVLAAGVRLLCRRPGGR